MTHETYDTWRANLIPSPDTLRLYITGKRTGYAIVRDHRWVHLWRVRSPDGSLSDMTNPTTAKDTAVGMALRERGSPAAATTANPSPP